jgi:hypothetical protein
MAGLFKRFRRGKEPDPKKKRLPEAEEDEGTDPDPDEIEPSEAGSQARFEPELADDARVEAQSIVQELLATSSAAEPAPSPGVPDPIGPGGAPPPLPQADPEPRGGARTDHGTYVRCFLCGTAMDGPWCPTCRMVWND